MSTSDIHQSMLIPSPFLAFQYFAVNVGNDSVSVHNFAVNLRNDGTGFDVMANIGGGSMRIQ